LQPNSRSTAAFLRQRRRWFGGFLQTQWWYRAMIGDRQMGRLGTVMLPTKAVDTFFHLWAMRRYRIWVN
jgi:hypothetical protein